ncbi:MAG: IPTL-CTERM sorting domain-containing protein, partial [Xanthomonadales bacterium]|nr:IPTL-CTERM sorting domain-containing protein [Xanthomonadales bacterium]
GATAVNASTVSDTSDPVTANNVGNVSVQVGFPIEEIPTVNQYGLILLGLMLGLLGFVAVRRNS